MFTKQYQVLKKNRINTKSEYKIPFNTVGVCCQVYICILNYYLEPSLMYVLTEKTVCPEKGVST